MSKSNQKGVPTFTLDFSKWCKRAYTHNGKSCAIQQAKNSGVTTTVAKDKINELTLSVIDVNDSNISRKDKISKLKSIFSKFGIRMMVKNQDYGMKKNK